MLLSWLGKRKQSTTSEEAKSPPSTPSTIRSRAFVDHLKTLDLTTRPPGSPTKTGETSPQTPKTPETPPKRASIKLLEEKKPENAEGLVKQIIAEPSKPKKTELFLKLLSTCQLRQWLKTIENDLASAFSQELNWLIPEVFLDDKIAEKTKLLVLDEYLEADQFEKILGWSLDPIYKKLYEFLKNLDHAFLLKIQTKLSFAKTLIIFQPEAPDATQLALKRNPYDILLGYYCFRMSKWLEKKLKGKSYCTLINHGINDLNKQRFDFAKEEFENAYKIHREHKLLLLIAYCNYHLEKFELAKEALENYFSMHPHEEFILKMLTLVRSHLESKDPLTNLTDSDKTTLQKLPETINKILREISSCELWYLTRGKDLHDFTCVREFMARVNEEMVHKKLSQKKVDQKIIDQVINFLMQARTLHGAPAYFLLSIFYLYYGDYCPENRTQYYADSLSYFRQAEVLEPYCTTQIVNAFGMVTACNGFTLSNPEDWHTFGRAIVHRLNIWKQQESIPQSYRRGEDWAKEFLDSNEVEIHQQQVQAARLC